MIVAIRLGVIFIGGKLNLVCKGLGKTRGRVNTLDRCSSFISDQGSIPTRAEIRGRRRHVKVPIDFYFFSAASASLR